MFACTFPQVSKIVTQIMFACTCFKIVTQIMFACTFVSKIVTQIMFACTFPQVSKIVTQIMFACTFFTGFFNRDSDYVCLHFFHRFLKS